MTIKGPAIFLAQFAGDKPPFDTLDNITKWAAGLGYKGVQIPSWDGRMIDLKKAAESKDYCDEIKGICEKNNVIFHSDTVQTIGHYAIDLNKINIQGIVGSAHKFHGPKGIGFLYLNNKHKISPFIHGGAQERNMRGGTENVYGIVGLSEALTLAYENMATHKEKIIVLKSHMIESLKQKVKGVKFNGLSSDLDNSLYTVLNTSIPNVDDHDEIELSCKY